MKIKTSELTGKALDWVVARAIGAVEITEGTTRRLELPDGYSVYDRYASTFSPSTTWSQCGPLIDLYLISVTERGTEGWCADRPHWGVMTGRTAKEAICRAAIAELGDEIEIPDELLEEE
ncbi:phage protein NinX family protein [Xenorhabdus bovienii]|uniref:phage protein NinX family protein n=1 Tax=Xenorhabdus bovienii TaxID=40576 RepID=UPI003DA24D16